MSPNYSIAGIDWVAGEVRRTGDPSVASLSFGGKWSPVMNKAVKEACAGRMERDGKTTDV